MRRLPQWLALSLRQGPFASVITPPSNIPSRLDLTVRVGCSLTYEVTGTASLLNASMIRKS